MIALLALGFLAAAAGLLYWLVPVGSLTLGNDYVHHCVHWQMEMIFALRTGAYPLYMPGYLGGQTSAAMTAGNLFHPITVVGLLPGYWSGRALDWNTVFRIFSLAAAHAGLFSLLRRLRLRSIAAFLVSMVTVYNMRMIDLFRYGAAMEAWTGHLLLCVCLGLSHFHPGSRVFRIGVTFFTYWTVVNGQPQFAYFGLITAVLFTLILPFFADALLPEEPRHPRLSYWIRMALFAGLGVLLAAAYWVPFAFELLPATTGRTDQSLGWALVYQEDFWHALRALVDPLRADVHGAFAGSYLYLAALMAPVILVRGRRMPPAVFAAWGAAVFAFIASIGGNTPIYRFLWEWVPLFSSFRVPGRLTMIAPVMLMFVLAWMFGRDDLREHRRPMAVLFLLAIPAALIIHRETRGLPSSWFNPMAVGDATLEARLAVTLIGFLGMILITLHRWRGSLNSWLLVLGTIAVGAQLAITFRNATWVEGRITTPTFEQLTVYRAWGWFSPHESALMGEKALAKRQEAGIPKPKDFVRLQAGWIPVSDQTAAIREMSDRSDKAHLVMERADGAPAEAGRTGRVRIQHSSYNRFLLSVQAAGAGNVLVTGLVLPKHWRATVDGRPTQVFRSGAAYVAVDVPPGNSTVELRYHSPASIVGFAISAGTLMLIGFWIFARGGNGFRWAGAILAIVAVVGFSSWWSTLYRGHATGFTYRWNAPVS